MDNVSDIVYENKFFNFISVSYQTFQLENLKLFFIIRYTKGNSCSKYLITPMAYVYVVSG